MCDAINSTTIKKLLTIIGATVLVTVLAAVSVNAAEDQFIIGQLTSDNIDVTAPSIPTNLTATAVSQTQIDLTWTASTDDTAVTGYNIYRDSVFIGTTAATNYSDSGLSPGTTYTYTVTAFDAEDNESAESDPATATTFSATQSGPTTTTNGSSVILLEYLNVSPDFLSALVAFGTNLPVQATVSWGKTRDLELGSIASALYQEDHYVQITGLEPGTKYFYKIVLVDGYGRTLTVDNEYFRTLSLPDVFPPANVSNFKATPKDATIVLTWKNPTADFDIVRIVKSDKFYPRDPGEGEIIYEGRAERYVDEDVEYGKTYYYSAFSRDRAGNFSSGAVTDARLLRPGEEPQGPKLFGGILQLPKELIDPLFRKFSILDIDFIQDGVKLPVVSDTVQIRGDRNLTISIDYDKVPEILKTIAVTMFDPEDKSKTFSFLLRVNEDKTAYQAHIAAFERPGRYQFALAILDYKHQGLASLAGTIVARVPDLFANKDGFFATLFDGSNFIGWLFILFLIVLYTIHRMLRKRKEAREAREAGQTGEGAYAQRATQ